MSVRLRLIGNTNGIVVLQPSSLSVGIAGKTQSVVGINFADSGESFVAGVREVDVAALSVVKPLRLNRGAGFWNEGSCLPDGDHLSHGKKTETERNALRDCISNAQHQNLDNEKSLTHMFPKLQANFVINFYEKIERIIHERDKHTGRMKLIGTNIRDTYLQLFYSKNRTSPILKVNLSRMRKILSKPAEVAGTSSGKT